MKSIKDMIELYSSKGMTIFQAESYVCQEIILRKISQSPFADNILIKGGVVMFNLTNNLRRATIDLDFDFIRYDISDESLKTFIILLNKYDSFYKIEIIRIEALHQENYHGKRLFIIISDNASIIKFKLDIGVHTLLAIEQSDACFYFDEENPITLRINPPEQIVAEKLYSLAKHGVASTRYKDLFDVYYLIKNKNMDKKIVVKCIELLLINKSTSFCSVDDIVEIITNIFDDKYFLTNLNTTKEKWLDVDNETLIRTILDYIHSL